jgi:prepilin-type N-terminal cleavage/methylation domain-containing protein
MSRDGHRKAFTLIEVLIVVIIMAVLAATIIPQFSSSTQDAMESSLKFNTHTMRSQIELYKLHHLGAYPTITNNTLLQLTNPTNINGVTGEPGPDYPFGPYVRDQLPTNPFNDLNTVVPGTGTPGDGSSGWQYDVRTGGIWPNHSGWTP